CVIVPRVRRMASEVSLNSCCPGRRAGAGRSQKEAVMARYIACLAMALLVEAPLYAGELDAEFATKASPAPAVQKGAVVAAQPAAVPGATAAVPKASELDSEAPADAVRGGWHGGWHGGWGRGWGGGWRGGWGWGGWGWGRGWTVGWRGGW